jgi:hypothetical protein
MAGFSSGNVDHSTEVNEDIRKEYIPSLKPMLAKLKDREGGKTRVSESGIDYAD